MSDKDTLYARWLSNKLTEAEKKLLSEEGLDDLERIIETTDNWGVKDYDATQGYQKFRKKHPIKTAKVRTINWKQVVGMAASFLLLFGFWTFFTKDNTQTILAQNGNNEQIDIMDGSSIIVNDGSEIAYNPENWTKERQINLTGEAFFKVEKGAPFVVHTNNGSVHVLGTAFNVRAWGDNLRVECYEGKVQVRAGKEELIIIKNEAVNIVNRVSQAKQTINHESPQWTNGLSRFYEEPINQVFGELERQYNVTVKISTINRPFSGGFNHDNLENALLSICKPLGLEYKISENQKEVFIEQ